MATTLCGQDNRALGQAHAGEAGSPERKAIEQQWFALNTLPQNERSVARYLEMYQIETFLPTCESVRQRKNRQRVTVVEALFPTYVFARIEKTERGVVLRSPGVRGIVGNHQGPIALPANEIEFLRMGVADRAVEPFSEIAVGQRVRIRGGSLQGLEGTLIRKKSSLRFVLTLQLIGQSAAVEVSAEDLEQVQDQP
ncbi:MAG: transcription termination/antitermination NusG family protein [Terracidiphilus sp.]|nr:transcription termination/antitermination NusG family protein [Terracidiphilus sp.]